MRGKVIIKKSDMLFYFAYLLYFIARYSEYTSINNSLIEGIASLCKNLSYLICGLVIFINLKKDSKINLRKSIFHLLVLALILYQVISNDGKAIFVVLLFGYAFSTRNLKDFLKFNFYLNVVSYIGTILLSCVGIIQNIKVKAIKFDSIWYREALGFDYPGELLMMLIPLIFLYYYLNAENINIIKNIIWIIIICIAFYFCRTIMPALECLAFIVAVNCLRNIAKWKYMYLIAPFSVIITFVFLYLYNKEVSIAILVDRISNYRFSLGNIAIEKYGITWLGTGFKHITTNDQYIVLDSEYTFMLVAYGIIYTLVAIYMLTKMIKWASENHDDMLVWVLAFYSVHAIFNNGIYNLIMNPFIIVLASLIGNDFMKWKIKLKQKSGFANMIRRV